MVLSDDVEGDIKAFTDNIYNESARIKDEITSDFGDEFNKVPQSNIESNLIEKKLTFDFVNISWKTYRAVSIGLIFISIFFANFFRLTLEKKITDPDLLMIINILILFFILNLGIFLFYKTYYEYIISKKGANGKSGKRGKQGLQGENSVCDISKKKMGTFQREKTTTKREIIEDEDNTVVEFDKLESKKKRKWYSIPKEHISNNRIGIN
jgi:hypothetical protein